jgi:hypothetical protein
MCVMMNKGASMRSKYNGFFAGLDHKPAMMRAFKYTTEGAPFKYTTEGTPFKCTTHALTHAPPYAHTILYTPYAVHHILRSGARE